MRAPLRPSPRDADCRDVQRDDQGTTLVELLVAMTIMGLLLSACLTIYVASLRTASGTQARLEEINDGRIAVSAMGRSLRTAILPSQLPNVVSVESAAFIEATPFSISFFANIDNEANRVGATKVSYAVIGGELRETRQAPDPVTASETTLRYCTPGLGCPTATRILARGVVVSRSALFVYYDVLGSRLTGATLTRAQLEDVDAMDVVVTIQQPRSGGDGTTYALRVALPNHDGVVRAEET